MSGKTSTISAEFSSAGVVTSVPVDNTTLGAIIDPIADPDGSPTLGQVECDNTHRNTHLIHHQSILHLPVELLAHIFQLCLTEHRQPSPTVAPLLLCQICTLWREIALMTPQLWTSFSLLQLIARSGPTDFSKYEEAANWWFERAGTVPLALTLRVTRPDFMYYHTYFFETLGQLILLPHANQIRTLNLHFPHPVDVADHALWLEVLPQDRMFYPCLESLAVHTDVRDAYDQILIFSLAPQLRKVKLQKVDQRQISLCWEQLTELYINDLWACDLMILLSRCTNLERASFFLVGSSLRALPAVVLPHLTRLSLVFSDSITWAHCFRRSQFPALSRLSITNDIRHLNLLQLPDYTNPVHLYSQLHGIYRLTLSYISASNTIDILHHSNLVSRFKVVCRREDSEDHYRTLFRALAVIDGSTYLLPNLEDFTLRCTLPNVECFCSEDFIDMLRSRQRLPASARSLPRVTVQFVDTPRTLQEDLESAVRKSWPFDAPELIFEEFTKYRDFEAKCRHHWD